MYCMCVGVYVHVLLMSFVNLLRSHILSFCLAGISQGPPGDGTSLPVIPQGGPQGQGVDGQYQSAPGIIYLSWYYLILYILLYLTS